MKSKGILNVNEVPQSLKKENELLLFFGTINETKSVGRAWRLVAPPDFKSGMVSDEGPGGFDSHILPPHLSQNAKCDTLSGSGEESMCRPIRNFPKTRSQSSSSKAAKQGYLLFG